MRRATIGILLALAGCATGTPTTTVAPRPNLKAADYYPLSSGWKWAYDLEKDGMNVLATYAVVERDGDVAVIQTGDERLTYAISPQGVAQKDGMAVGDFVIR
jgi:hypothetical protein